MGPPFFIVVVSIAGPKSPPFALSPLNLSKLVTRNFHHGIHEAAAVTITVAFAVAATALVVVIATVVATATAATAATVYFTASHSRASGQQGSNF